MAVFIDLTGQRLGRWSVLSREENNKFGQTRWRCKCICGKEVVVVGDNLRNGHTKSCGCFNREQSGKRNFKDITGKVYVNLTVISRVGSNKKGNAMWRCKCICGNEVVISGNHLLSGKTRSCGCLKRISSSINGQDPIKIMKHICTIREQLRNGTHHALKDGRYRKIEFY